MAVSETRYRVDRIRRDGAELVQVADTVFDGRTSTPDEQRGWAAFDRAEPKGTEVVLVRITEEVVARKGGVA